MTAYLFRYESTAVNFSPLVIALSSENQLDGSVQSLSEVVELDQRNYVFFPLNSSKLKKVLLYKLYDIKTM